MKFVICVYNGIFESTHSKYFNHSERLTIGKIYKVLELVNDNFVFIKDNLGDSVTYSLKSGDTVWFKDATQYIREIKLNQLGIIE